MGTIGDGMMDPYRYNRSILLVMLITDSIDPSVKDFFFLIDSIDHQSQNPCQTDDLDPSVHFQPMVLIHRSKIHSPITISMNEGEPSKNILQQLAALNYDGLKGLWSKRSVAANC
jgi:hypothetical protein